MSEKTKLLGKFLVAGLAIIILLAPNFASAQAKNDACDGITDYVFSGPECVVYGLATIAALLGSKFVLFGAALTSFAFWLNSYVTQSPPVVKGFEVALSFANLGFIIGLIVIAIATILRQESYGMKQLLVKLIFMAVFINFSMVVAGIFITGADGLSKYFLEAITPDGSGDFTARISQAFMPQSLFKEPAGFMDRLGNSLNLWKRAQIMSQELMSLLFSVVFTLAFGIILIVFGVMLLARYLWLSFLLIVMPLAWMAFIFPHLATYWSKWWGKFLKWVFFAPLLMFFLYLALLMTPGEPAYDNYTAAIGGGTSPVTTVSVINTITANPADGNTVNVAGTVWRFKNAPSAPGDVLIGPTLAATLKNLQDALSAYAAFNVGISGVFNLQVAYAAETYILPAGKNDAYKNSKFEVKPDGKIVQTKTNEPPPGESASIWDALTAKTPNKAGEKLGEVMGKPGSATGGLIHMLLILGLLVGGLIAASSLGIMFTKGAMSTAGKAAKWTGGKVLGAGKAAGKAAGRRGWENVRTTGAMTDASGKTTTALQRIGSALQGVPIPGARGLGSRIAAAGVVSEKEKEGVEKYRKENLANLTDEGVIKRATGFGFAMMSNEEQAAISSHLVKRGLFNDDKISPARRNQLVAASKRMDMYEDVLSNNPTMAAEETIVDEKTGKERARTAKEQTEAVVKAVKEIKVKNILNINNEMFDPVKNPEFWQTVVLNISDVNLRKLGADGNEKQTEAYKKAAQKIFDDHESGALKLEPEAVANLERINRIMTKSGHWQGLEPEPPKPKSWEEIVAENRTNP